MQTLQQQIAALQVIVHQQHVSAKRQRLLNIALLSVIVAGGEAVLTFADVNEKKRITTIINHEGSATMSWADKRGVVRIGAGIDANGNVLLPTYDFILLAKP